MTDLFELSRFLDAQENIYADVLDELQQGSKTGHWMWYVFPQLEGLGHSAVSRRYAISSIEEAQAYLDHPILGTRLVECTQLVIAVKDRSVQQIFGHPDCLKFRSSMTLFRMAARRPCVFQQALDKYFAGEADSITLELLGDEAPGISPSR